MSDDLDLGRVGAVEPESLRHFRIDRIRRIRTEHRRDLFVVKRQLLKKIKQY